MQPSLVAAFNKTSYSHVWSVMLIRAHPLGGAVLNIIQISAIDFGLELIHKVHLLKVPAFFLELLQARHHRHIHAAVLGAPLLERRRAHTQLSVRIGHRKARFETLDSIHERLSVNFDFLIQYLFSRKNLTSAHWF